MVEVKNNPITDDLFNRGISAEVKSITRTPDGTFLIEGTIEALEKLFSIKGRTVKLICGNLYSVGKRGGRKYIGGWDGTTVEINKESQFRIRIDQ